MTFRNTVVSERWPGLSRFWACTYCAGVMGRRYEIDGHRHDGTELVGDEAEVRRLAAASGDPDLLSGSNTRELIRAIERHYGGHVWTSQRLDRDEWTRYTTVRGFGLVVGLTAGLMPSSVRRFYGSFTGGHRAFWISEGRKDSAHHPLMRVLDPLMPQGHAGIECRSADLWRAVWSGEVIVLHSPDRDAG